MDEGFDRHPEEEAIDRARRGGLDRADRAMLERHRSTCPTCAAELEMARAFESSLVPGAADAVLDRAAVHRAMARFTERGRARTLWRRWLRATAGAAALGGAFTITLALSLSLRRQPSVPAAASAPPPEAVTLADGSEIAPDDAATAIQIGEQTPARTTVRLSTGGARFRVRHDGRRLFRVDVGPLEIEDLGTVFRVFREPGGRVRVSVSEGRVAVHHNPSGLRVELVAGDDRTFSTGAEPPAAVDPAREATEKPVASGTSSARAPSRPRMPDDPARLLTAADVARRSHEPRPAVASLRRFLERYPRDPRAPSAAFTLGWVLLTDLGRPREAALAFANVERMAPHGALAEDAAARVVQSWHDAGDARRASDAARRYEQEYPAGRHTALVRGFAGAR